MAAEKMFSDITETDIVKRIVTVARLVESLVAAADQREILEIIACEAASELYRICEEIEDRETITEEGS